MFRSLRYQGCRVEVRAQARAGGQQSFSIYTDRRLAAMRGMRTAVVVKDHPVANPLTIALLDRLTHHCEIIETGNDSWRFKNRS